MQLNIESESAKNSNDALKNNSDSDGKVYSMIVSFYFLSKKLVFIILMYSYKSASASDYSLFVANGVYAIYTYTYTLLIRTN